MTFLTYILLFYLYFPKKYRLVNKGCKLVGCGSAVPSLSVSNDDLAKIVDTSDEWISVRTGIRNRRVISGKGSIVDSFASISCLPLM